VAQAENGVHTLLVLMACKLEQLAQVVLPLRFLRKNLDSFGFFVNGHAKVLFEIGVQLNGINWWYVEIRAIFFGTMCNHQSEVEFPGTFFRGGEDLRFDLPR